MNFNALVLLYTNSKNKKNYSSIKEPGTWSLFINNMHKKKIVKETNIGALCHVCYKL